MITLDGNDFLDLGYLTPRKICTREEYEQALKEKKELDMAVNRLAKLADKPSDWYDYDKKEQIEGMQLLAGEKVLIDDFGYESIGWFEAEILFFGENVIVYKAAHTSETSCYINDCMIKPLDHNKHQVKTVSLDWLVGSGIDCEFRNNHPNENWFVDKLKTISAPSQIPRSFVAESMGNLNFQCRPRQNRPMVLTDEQVKLIPDRFVYEHEACLDRAKVKAHNIVTFKGLKDGYKYEWES